MIYTVNIDGDVAAKYGLSVAIVYAYLIAEGEDVALVQIERALPYLSQRQIRYARDRLVEVGLIGDVTKCMTKCMTKCNTKCHKRQNTRNKRPNYILSNKLNTMKTGINTNLNIDSLLDDRSRDIGGMGGKEKNLISLEKTQAEKPEAEPVKTEVKAATAATSETYKEIIDYLNFLANTRYRWQSKQTQRFINARLSEGYTVEDFKRVIRVKVKEWKDSDMGQYLRPQTLFRPSNFESYLNQPEPVEKTKPESSFDSDEFMAAALKRAYSEGGDET